LSAGAIAGIVIGTAVLTGLMVGLICFFMKRSQKSSPQEIQLNSTRM